MTDLMWAAILILGIWLVSDRMCEVQLDRAMDLALDTEVR